MFFLKMLASVDMKSITLFDKSQLEFEKPEEGLEDFQKEFLESRSEELKKVHILADQGNFDEISKLSHTWKGFSKPYGFEIMGQLAIILEKSSIDKDLDSLSEVIYNLNAYLDLKRKQLKFN